ncbi:hypothetical protein POF50_002715 [Streptomyces sp. SL13]|uniref:Uncharacterized protein n=1 Tax=Streptantibioticus silvisoli TaxID=2705255 RepID=A0AA90GUG8_9ACTN|nr:hypothetical protein [Streptantibioticus silvisoli]MDI5968268.1 hypothetical protein [Streptantibioticus silvisoli]
MPQPPHRPPAPAAGASHHPHTAPGAAPGAAPAPSAPGLRAHPQGAAA